MNLFTTGYFHLLFFNIVFANANDRIPTADNPTHEVFGGFGYASVEVFAPASDAVESDLCRNHSIQLIKGAKNQELWALKMLDATTKDPDGILLGSLFQLGNYDECLSVQAVASDAGTFSGRHCLVSLGPSSLFSEIELAKKTTEKNMMLVGERLYAIQGGVHAMISVMGATIGVCIPSSCTSRDLERHLRREMRSTNISVRVDDLACSSSVDEIEFQTNDWCAIALLACFGATVAGSTFFDLVYTNSGSRHDLLTAFSLYSNVRKLLKAALPGDDIITTLNGVRVLSMVWVVLIHRVLIAIVVPSSNFTLKEHGFKEFNHIIVSNGTLCIEPFLLLSGLLVSYNFLKEREKGVRFNLLRYYMHRYIRLTPSYAAMMLLTATLVNYLGNGPMWKSNMAASRESCEKNWIFGLLYVNNYYPGENMCMGRMNESWYLAVEMQLFLLSPLILLPLWRWPRGGKVLLGIMITAGLFIACAVPYINRFPYSPIPGNNVAAFSQYFTTHTRFTPWLIGICLGYVLHMTKNKQLRLSRAVVVGGWILGLLVLNVAFLSAYFFLHKDHVYDRLSDSVYTGLSRPGFALGVACIVFACAKGYGGKLNAFLSCSAMQVLGRLTYAVYLTHLTVLRHFFASVKHLQYFSVAVLLPDYISNVLLSFAMALVLHLVVEAPIQNIERVLRGTPNASRRNPTKKTE